MTQSVRLKLFADIEKKKMVIQSVKCFQTIMYRCTISLCLTLSIGFQLPIPSFANGICPTLSSVVPSESKLLGDKLIGLASVHRGRVRLHSIYKEFGGFIDKHWFAVVGEAPSEKTDDRALISLFSKNGYLCDIWIKKQYGQWVDEGTKLFNWVPANDSVDCKIDELQKRDSLLFVYPSIGHKFDRASLTPPDELMDTVKSFMSNLIVKYIKEANLKIFTKTMDERIVEIKIFHIGRRKNYWQFFVEAVVAPQGKVRERWQFETFSFVITATKGHIAVHRIDFLPSGGDSSGGIKLEASCDVNQDGFADIFWIRAGCCGYIIEYDGSRWVRLGHVTPM